MPASHPPPTTPPLSPPAATPPPSSKTRVQTPQTPTPAVRLPSASQDRLATLKEDMARLERGMKRVLSMKYGAEARREFEVLVGRFASVAASVSVSVADGDVDMDTDTDTDVDMDVDVHMDMDTDTDTDMEMKKEMKTGDVRRVQRVQGTRALRDFLVGHPEIAGSWNEFAGLDGSVPVFWELEREGEKDDGAKDDDKNDDSSDDGGIVTAGDPRDGDLFWMSEEQPSGAKRKREFVLRRRSEQSVGERGLEGAGGEGGDGEAGLQKREDRKGGLVESPVERSTKRRWVKKQKSA